jgi:hypothetical protein
MLNTPLHPPELNHSLPCLSHPLPERLSSSVRLRQSRDIGYRAADVTQNIRIMLRQRMLRSPGRDMWQQ